GVNRALRAAGWYGSTRSEPDLRQWLVLVALGTVGDVVPLTGVNRALGRQGLRVMADRSNIGLAALADVARLREPPGAYHLGFMLGPRVNAGGRVGQADLGARLPTSDDPEGGGGLGLWGWQSPPPGAAPSSARCWTRRSRASRAFTGPIARACRRRSWSRA